MRNESAFKENLDDISDTLQATAWSVTKIEEDACVSLVVCDAVWTCR
jgi:hypothetical protein